MIGRVGQDLPAERALLPPPDSAPPAIQAEGLTRRFGSTVALRDASLRVEAGEIHALLGRNGAGKTTTIRILTGLVDADAGVVRFFGKEPTWRSAHSRRQFGLIPSGDRTLYLRISGLENLLFFGRLYGLSKTRARARAWEVLEAVGLQDAARRRVGLYSHGMQKRLAIARALLIRPPILYVDEATHDLDPEGARRVREIVLETARQGTAVLWTTQRIDEIRGFADGVTLLRRGEVRFVGTVPALMARSLARRYVLEVRSRAHQEAIGASVGRALRPYGVISPLGHGDEEHFLLSLREGAVLGEAFSALQSAGIDLLACREERSEIEDAFLTLTRDDDE